MTTKRLQRSTFGLNNLEKLASIKIKNGYLPKGNR